MDFFWNTNELANKLSKLTSWYKAKGKQNYKEEAD